MSLKSTPLPDGTGKQSLFECVLSAQERHVIQSAAPRFLQLVNDRAEDGAWSRREAEALQRHARNCEYRVRTYPLSEDRADRRLLWIQFRPKPEPKAKRS